MMPNVGDLVELTINDTMMFTHANTLVGLLLDIEHPHDRRGSLSHRAKILISNGTVRTWYYAPLAGDRIIAVASQ